MIAKQFLHPKEIIELLSKLKEKTPDYPTDLMAARKAAFLKQIDEIKPDQPGQGGGGSGLSGTGLGGLSSMQGILLQAVIGVWIMAAMLMVMYIFREHITDWFGLNEKVFITVDTIPLPADVPISLQSPAPGATDAAVTEFIITPESTKPEDSQSNGSTTDSSSSTESSPDNSKGNHGLHKGQTPGPPNSDKPDKPDKPNKK